MVLSLEATFIVTGETREKALVVQVIKDAGEELGVVQEGCMVWAPNSALGDWWEGLKKVLEWRVGQEFQSEGTNLAQN